MGALTDVHLSLFRGDKFFQAAFQFTVTIIFYFRTSQTSLNHPCLIRASLVVLWAAADAQSLKLAPLSFLPALVTKLWRHLWLSRDKEQSDVAGLETSPTCGPGDRVSRGPSLSKDSNTSAWELWPPVPMAFSLLSLPLDTHEHLIPCVKRLPSLLLAQPGKMEMPSGCSGEVTLLHIVTQMENNLCCQCLKKLFWGNCLLYERLRQDSFPVLCFPW